MVTKAETCPSSKDSACSAGRSDSIPGSGRAPGKGNGNPLQYSCLGNPMDSGALQVTYSPWNLKRVGLDLASKQQQTNKDLLYSTENSTQYSMRKESEIELIYVYI